MDWSALQRNLVLTDQEHRYVIYHFMKLALKQEVMPVSIAPQEQHCSVCLCSHLRAQRRVRDAALLFTGWRLWTTPGPETAEASLESKYSSAQQQKWKTLHVQPNPHKANLAGDSIGCCAIKINFLYDFCLCGIYYRFQLHQGNNLPMLLHSSLCSRPSSTKTVCNNLPKL